MTFNVNITGLELYFEIMESKKRLAILWTWTKMNQNREFHALFKEMVLTKI